MVDLLVHHDCSRCVDILWQKVEERLENNKVKNTNTPQSMRWFSEAIGDFLG